MKRKEKLGGNITQIANKNKGEAVGLIQPQNSCFSNASFMPNLKYKLQKRMLWKKIY